MTYYNKQSAKKEWVDLNPYTTKNRCARRYVRAPNPGRNFDFTVSLYSLLVKTYQSNTVMLKKLIYQGGVKVNEKVVKELDHPVHYLDYLEINDKKHQVFFMRDKKLTTFYLSPYQSKNLLYNVKKWVLKKGKCIVNTFQNKIFTFEISPQLFESLRPYDSVINKNIQTGEYEISTLTILFPKVKLIKLTGKDKYHCYEILDLKIQNENTHLRLIKENDPAYELSVILRNIDFRKRYIFLDSKRL